MTNEEAFAEALAACPLIAILRGVRPDEVEAIGEVLVETGFRIVEVPLNSPDPFASIARLAGSLAGRAIVGAGTVLTVDDISRLRGAGGQIVISPNTDIAVIAATRAAGLVSLPGYSTPSEAIAALAAGAHALKLFPAEAATPAILKAHRAVLPADVRIIPVGGISPDAMERWRDAGAAGFGLGSALYRAGDAPDHVRAAALSFQESQ